MILLETFQEILHPINVTFFQDSFDAFSYEELMLQSA